MEYVTVKESLATFDKIVLTGKFIKFDKTKDLLTYDLERFKLWLDRHFIVDIHDYFQESIVFEVVYVKEQFDNYYSPTGRL